jgi:two-component sensor histidine kinase
MTSLIKGLGSQHKHKIDFSLVPIGVILIEFSVFTTQLSKDHYSSLRNLVALRIIHTIIMVTFSILLSRLFIKLKYTELNYRTIAITGTLTIALGDLIHRYLGHKLGVELVSMDRRIGIILLQGCFWFPAFVIIGSKRTQIFEAFKEYEKRLVIATRARSRTSDEFAEIQRNIQNRIKSELSTLCNSLKSSITSIPRSSSLSDYNEAIQPRLLGEELRKLSMNLETFGSEHQGAAFMGQNLNSVNLLIKQFRILYSTTAKNAPLRTSTYAIVLIVLVTPPYINYFSLTETLVAYPLMSLSVVIASRFISKSLASSSPNSIRNSSILIYLTGFLPVLSNVIGQAITHDPNTKYPVLLTSIVLPSSYYVFIKVFQVLNPHALELIQNDDLKASEALQEAVTKVVSDEFSHTLSHRWAIFIHGKILTRLAATALKLETAANVEDKQVFDSAVESLISLLSSPDAEFEQEPTDLGSEVSSRLDPWIGLLEVDLHVDSDLASIKNSRVRNLGEVIEELVSNSMRHGKAQKLDLRVIKAGEKDIEIIATDNSTIAPPELQSRYGLGTRIFNLASDGRWSITRVDSRTEFKLTMSMDF